MSITSEPTPEQVEAAAKAIYEVRPNGGIEWDSAEFDEWMERGGYRAKARAVLEAALVAAQSAVPQESSRLPDFFAPKPMPNGYIPVPQEPTEAQVEAAAKALRADEGFMEEVHSALEVSWSEYIARLVLAAAQGAAPQAECDCGAGPGSAVCKKVCATRAPVLPSSGVDEDD